MVRLSLVFVLASYTGLAGAGPLAALFAKGAPASSSVRTATATRATSAPVVRASMTEPEANAADAHHLVRPTVELARRHCDKSHTAGDSGQTSDRCRASGQGTAAGGK
jgi:hypothetical protein